MAPLPDDRAAQKFAGTAQAYAASFAHLCAGAVEPLLAAVGLDRATAPGRRVLDVGTGAGAVASRAVALGADVTAVDPDEGMRLLAAQAAPGALVRAGGVPALPFDDGRFDVVVANVVVNHVSDPLAAVRDLVRVTASGGRVGVTIWPVERGPLGAVWAVVAAAGEAGWPPDPLPAAQDFARTPDGLADLLGRAGLTGAEGRRVRWSTRIDPERLWSGVAAGVAAIGQVVAARPPAVRARMKAAFDTLVAPGVTDGELVLPTVAVLATGTRP